ncbi:hypothetical protein [Streptomyces sp. NPDC002133]|uniref:hypothetical protein n=1 Tax=Streptomyces sp. NPDC002133 TaxID=3154409 RepID=UPI0033167A20
MVLMRSLGEPVDSAPLRVSTSDKIHTERHTMELRELEFNIVTSEADGNQYYTLVDLQIDNTKLPKLVENVIRDSRALTSADKHSLIVKPSE